MIGVDEESVVGRLDNGVDEESVVGRLENGVDEESVVGRLANGVDEESVEGNGTVGVQTRHNPSDYDTVCGRRFCVVVSSPPPFSCHRYSPTYLTPFSHPSPSVLPGLSFDFSTNAKAVAATTRAEQNIPPVPAFHLQAVRDMRSWLPTLESWVGDAPAGAAAALPTFATPVPIQQTPLGAQLQRGAAVGAVPAAAAQELVRFAPRPQFPTETASFFPRQFEGRPLIGRTRLEGRPVYGFPSAAHVRANPKTAGTFTTLQLLGQEGILGAAAPGGDVVLGAIEEVDFGFYQIDQTCVHQIIGGVDQSGLKSGFQRKVAARIVVKFTVTKEELVGGSFRENMSDMFFSRILSDHDGRSKDCFHSGK